MESKSMRDRPVEMPNIESPPGADGAHLPSPIAVKAWLAAMPYPAATFSFKDNDLSVVSTNAAFGNYFSQAGERAARPHAKEWRERIVQCVLSEKDSESFELRRDGVLGPEYFYCTVGRLPKSGDESDLFL